MPADNTPIIIGVGQFTEHFDDPDYQWRSPQELAALAALASLDDAGPGGGLAEQIDVIAAVRTVADSVGPEVSQYAAPFGGPENFPGAVARRVGCESAYAIYSQACGDEPQKLVGELSERIASGEFSMALLVGAEAIASQRKAQGEGKVLDWNEPSAGAVEDRGKGTRGLVTPHMQAHGIHMPVTVYPVFEHARRKRLGLSREDYAASMGELFAGFSEVAAQNPYAMSRQQLSAEAITAVNDSNRMIADPYTKAMVARDWVNQGAAVLLTSVAKARSLGIPAERWVYLHGYASAAERSVPEREDLGASPAMNLAYQAALSAAGVEVADISHFDLYSCFPIAVLAACDGLGVDPQTDRQLTVTGGLPYFGGPGNNYSMHGIASVVDKLRADPGSYGLVGANGGVLSKHSVGVYSTIAVQNWQPCDSSSLQARVDGLPVPAFSLEPQGPASVESYTVVYGGKGPKYGVVVGRLEGSGERFFAQTAKDDEATLAAMIEGDPLQRQIVVSTVDSASSFTFAANS
jgi:acetyl-CoA C-acetyltransferase